MRLGEIYSENKILLADVDKSLYWFTKAGKLNYTPAQFKVANLYADRDDFKAASLWLEEKFSKPFPAVSGVSTLETAAGKCCGARR